MLDGTGLFFDGQKDFLSRADVAAGDEDLANAFVEIRAQIDAEFGPQEWSKVSESRYSSGDYSTCMSGGHEGRYTARDEGLTFGIADESFPRILHIITQIAEKIGYTHVVDSTDDTWFYIDIFNTEDGGYIHITKARGQGLILQVNTGCRPWAD